MRNSKGIMSISLNSIYQYLSWFDWALINEECYLPNPLYLLTNGNDLPEVDCEQSSRELTFAYASTYSGKN
jgi:hypothetical protein